MKNDECLVIDVMKEKNPSVSAFSDLAVCFWGTQNKIITNVTIIYIFVVL